VVEVRFVAPHSGGSTNDAGCRYTMFFPLYPIGIGAEWGLLYRAIAPGGKISAAIPPVFWFCLMLYIPGKPRVHLICCMQSDRDPGSYKMFTHMIKQRRKVLHEQRKNG
jgi:very-long-chain (3R)-3-hydroxyacyl-CoA dehydratase